MTNFGYNVLGFGSFANRTIEYTASSASTLNVESAFGSADYQSGTPKKLIVPNGVDLGPVTIPSGMGGTLQIENAGTIRGLGGTAGSAGSGGSGSGGNGGNGGAGGHAITSAHSFTLINTGEISGGGGGSGGSGGGGQGGTGGNGSYSAWTNTSYTFSWTGTEWGNVGGAGSYGRMDYNAANKYTFTWVYGTNQWQQAPSPYGQQNTAAHGRSSRHAGGGSTVRNNYRTMGGVGLAQGWPKDGHEWQNNGNTFVQANDSNTDPHYHLENNNNLGNFNQNYGAYATINSNNQLAFKIRKDYQTTASSSGGSGGNGGNGGSGAVGQGYGQSAGGANNGSGGSGGSSGGTSAGSGGTGGSGGNSSAGASFGAAGSNGSSGSTGSTGANGNVSNGSGGSSGGSGGSGGAAGKAASFSSGSITIVSNSGTINGATS